MAFILGKKIKMSQIFDDQGNEIPVTLVKALDCVVTQLKTKEKDGYCAVQLGAEPLKEKKIPKSKRTKPFRYLKEFRVTQEELKNFEVGKKISLDAFKEGELVTVSGISKGKGFAGAVKRWGFKGGPKSHGRKGTERKVGAIGASTPSRVIKGKKMPGRLGGERVTIKNLKIVRIDPENKILFIKGGLPGPKNSLLEIKTK